MKKINCIINEITSILNKFGYDISKFDDIDYELTRKGESTGITLSILVNDKYEYFVAAVMNGIIPKYEVGYKKYKKLQDRYNHPNMVSSFKNTREKLLLYEFIFRSLYFYEASKHLRKWKCYNCDEIGTEFFNDDGSISTFDSNDKEFKLIITNKKDIFSIVYDDHIGKYIIPTCEKCLGKLGYTVEDKQNFS